jgi:hypothetical protein
MVLILRLMRNTLLMLLKLIRKWLPQVSPRLCLGPKRWLKVFSQNPVWA